MADGIKLTIDGHEVTTQPGKTVIQAAMDAGLYIPYLCYYPSMKPYGACRMCVVEIENGRGLPASCTTPVSDGMTVYTNTQQVQDLRKGILDLLLSEHPHGCLTCHRIELCGPQDVCLRHVSVNDRCVVCPKNERCELKDTVRYVGVDMDTPLHYHHRNLQIEVRDPFYDRDYNLCIVCARCVRVCDEMRGDNAITVIERSGTALVGTSHGSSLLESGCEFCGACVDVCPVGALVERDYKWEKAVQTVNSVCTMCPVGCQVKLEVDKRDRAIRTIGQVEAPVNHGQLCFKGKFGQDYVNNRRRLKSPLVRRNGELQETTWDEALDHIARQLPQFRGTRFAAIAAPGTPNEDLYVLEKFTRTVVGSNNLDLASNTRPEAVAPLAAMLGYAAATGPLWDVEQARAVLVVTSNTTEEHNVAAVPVKRAWRSGAKVVVIDPREVELTRYAHVWLRPRPGTEPALVGGLLRVIADEALEDEEFVAEQCEGLDAYRALLQEVDLARVEETTGVPVGQIREAARVLAGANPMAVLYALDNVPRAQRESLTVALADLALVTGNVGRLGGGLYPMLRGANEQGARDVGFLPDGLPGGPSLDDPDARQRAQRVWDAEVPAARGLGIQGAVDAVRNGEIQAMWVMGYHHGLVDGVIAGAKETMQGLDFLVVQDLFRTEIAELADVVLPSAAFTERFGTLTNQERRVQMVRPARQTPPGEVRPDWWAVAQVATRMGSPAFAYLDVSTVFEEIAQVVPQYAGMDYERLNDFVGIQWPCPDADHPGTPLLYADGFPGGRARLEPVRDVPPDPADALTSDELPLLLAPGRVLHHAEREPEVVRGDGVNLVRGTERVEIHPEDARPLGLSEGDVARVVTASGERGPFTVELREDRQRGTVSITTLFGQLAVDLQASRDPMKMFKVPTLPLEAARVEQAGERWVAS